MTSSNDLNWILSGFAGRLPEVTQAIAVSVDGLALA
ncbi:roadblock/LC7 domain-containing protein, partial [Streptomyces sp. SID7982]|nr:roadblock/LC7 domain-containing protein [Streptomyces sp. SID7982]